MDAQVRRARGRRDRDTAAVAPVGIRSRADRPVPDGPLPDDRHRAYSGICRCTPRGEEPSPTSTTTRSSGTRTRGRLPAKRACRGSVAGSSSTAGRTFRSSRRRSTRGGQRHNSLMRDSPLRRRLWAFTMQGEDLPVASNRVDLDPVVRDVRGFPVARVTYKPHKHELVASWHHGPRLAAVLEEMGASWTSVVTTPGSAGGPGEGKLSDVPQSRHVMGTVRMGDDPATSVVDAYGRFHDLQNLVVADSSVFVTASGYGPTLTLAALAARAASELAGRPASPTLPSDTEPASHPRFHSLRMSMEPSKGPYTNYWWQKVFRDEGPSRAKPG